MNQTPLDVLKNRLLAAFGLFCFGVGVYLTIQANIGVAPWDAFCIVLSQKLGILYGTASIMISLTIVVIDLLLKERIGIGMILDAIVVGKAVDFCNWLNPVPALQNPFAGVLLMLAGLFVMGLSQFIYMKAALTCGPRDSMLVALGKRLPRVPLGVISIGILVIVLAIGWALGGPIGIGTVISTFCMGPMMQLAFSLVKFDAKKVEHQDLLQSFRVLFSKK